MTSAVLEKGDRRSGVGEDAQLLLGWPAGRERPGVWRASPQPTLDFLITELWSALERGEQGRCPVCVGTVVPDASATEGRCADCGTHVS